MVEKRHKKTKSEVRKKRGHGGEIKERKRLHRKNKIREGRTKKKRKRP